MARDLLGKVLVRVVDEGVMSGRIVEAEAYRGRRDPASHAYKGLTRRNAVMFGEPGNAYLYYSYGNHWCLNFTTEREGVPGAVLIRALEPMDGVELMKKNREVEKLVELTSGPGKLTKALMVDGTLNGEDLLTSGRMWVAGGGDERFEIATSPRIGILEGLRYRWRFYIRGNKFVSRAKPSNPQNA